MIDWQRELRKLANPERAITSARFFKCGPGEYGEGDRFLGVTVPQIRGLVSQSDSLDDSIVLPLLHSEWHEERLLALLIWVRRFGKLKKNEAERRRLVDGYLANTRWINNWDLVDSSAPPILGVWLLDKDRGILRKLARSKHLWEQRISILATLTFIRHGEFGDTIAGCELLLEHPHDLMHKACGWMLREMGKKDRTALKRFLDQHAARMPRTMLSYSIEKLSADEKKRYRSL